MRISNNPIHFGTVSRTKPPAGTAYKSLFYHGNLFYVTNGPNDTDMLDWKNAKAAQDQATKALLAYAGAHPDATEADVENSSAGQQWNNTFDAEQQLYCALLKKVGIQTEPIKRGA